MKKKNAVLWAVCLMMILSACGKDQSGETQEPESVTSAEISVVAEDPVYRELFTEAIGADMEQAADVAEQLTEKFEEDREKFISILAGENSEIIERTGYLLAYGEYFRDLGAYLDYIESLEAQTTQNSVKMALDLMKKEAVVLNNDLSDN